MNIKTNLECLFKPKLQAGVLPTAPVETFFVELLSSFATTWSTKNIPCGFFRFYDNENAENELMKKTPPELEVASLSPDSM